VLFAGARTHKQAKGDFGQISVSQNSSLIWAPRNGEEAREGRDLPAQFYSSRAGSVSNGFKRGFNYRQRQPDLEPKYSGDQSSSFLSYLLAGCGKTPETGYDQGVLSV
jgi:hypothetical protein